MNLAVNECHNVYIAVRIFTHSNAARDSIDSSGARVVDGAPVYSSSEGVCEIVPALSCLCIDLLKDGESGHVGVAVQSFESGNLLWIEFLWAQLDIVANYDDVESLVSTHALMGSEGVLAGGDWDGGGDSWSGNSHSRCK